MTRQNAWAIRAMDAIRRKLGGKCASCGTQENLELDCISPRGDWHHRAGRSARACFYRKESRRGNLQLLCTECHAAKTVQENVGERVLGFHPSPKRARRRK